MLYNDVKPKCSTWFNISKKSLLVVLLIFPQRYQLVFANYISHEFSTLIIKNKNNLYIDLYAMLLFSIKKIWNYKIQKQLH